MGDADAGFMCRVGLVETARAVGLAAGVTATEIVLALMGFSGLYLGEHCPSDVVGDYCLGPLLVMGVDRLVRDRSGGMIGGRDSTGRCRRRVTTLLRVPPRSGLD